MFYTIYKITNKINNKYYIGKHQTKNLDDGYMGSGKLLKKAISKYGIENFTKEILHIFDTEEEMNVKEKELVIVSEETYNLCEGGKGGFNYINSSGLRTKGHTKDMNLKRSNTLKKLYKTIPNYCLLNFSEEKRKEISLYATQKRLEKYPKGTLKFKQTKESIKKQKESQRKNKHQQGNKNSQFGTCWITNGTENKKIKKQEFDKWIELGYNKGRINLSVGKSG